MEGIIRAPDFDRAGLSWFNSDRPLTLSDLKGRLVILDFWTLCCINCLQALPTLQAMQDRFGPELAVIGVHSPKFPAEQNPEAVAAAIARHHVTHPVVHDPHSVLWDEYAIRAWPTLVFVSPDGYVIGDMQGEPHPKMLGVGLSQMLDDFRAEGVLRSKALPRPAPESHGGALRFPGKIKPVIRPGCPARWALADGGHHRVVLLDDDGAEARRFGSGRAGFEDGPAETAAFRDPQGVVSDGRAVYVADTGNHAIRAIDLDSGTVSTLAGDGVRGLALGRNCPMRASALASPWDLELEDRRLYFANAGTHQIGLLDLEAETVERLAGTGEENIKDGPAQGALLAQPSGLALDAAARRLYFVDAETSAVRFLDLEALVVTTLVGTGLFAFGGADGTFAEAELQHPLGIAVLEPGRRLAVADTFNDRVRLLDLATATVSTVPRGGLSRPAGLWAAGAGRLLVADSDAHRLVALDIGTGALQAWGP